ncbi:hypothetical protein FVE88_12140 [Ectopseudomonas mendocina]|nr:hypothetical protein [Pseudomonas mendocina]TXR38920.1 hypothetical protein FVE88_12140 [Pseudomonas mendocina]
MKRIELIVALANSLFLLASAGFLWPYVSSVLLMSILCGLSVLFNVLHVLASRKLEFNKEVGVFVSLFSLFFLWLDLPLRKDATVGAYLIYMVALFSLFLTGQNVRQKILEIIFKLVALSGWVSLIVFMLYFLGFKSFGYEASHPMSNKPYDLYLLVNVMQSQIWDLQGHSIIRSSGLLNEPGHFGILCAFLLMLNAYKISSWQDKGIAIGGVLTFSAAFYIMFFFMYLIFNCKSVKRNFSFLIGSTVFLSLLVMFAPKVLTDRLFQTYYIERYESSFSLENLLEARARGKGEVAELLDDISMGDLIIGYGRGFTAENPQYHTSDYRRALLDVGLVGIVLLFLIYAVMPLLFNVRLPVYLGTLLFFGLVLARISHEAGRRGR